MNRPQREQRFVIGEEMVVLFAQSRQLQAEGHRGDSAEAVEFRAVSKRSDWTLLEVPMLDRDETPGHMENLASGQG